MGKINDSVILVNNVLVAKGKVQRVYKELLGKVLQILLKLACEMQKTFG